MARAEENLLTGKRLDGIRKFTLDNGYAVRLECLREPENSFLRTEVNRFTDGVSGLRRKHHRIADRSSIFARKEI